MQLCLIQHGGGKIQVPAVLGRALLSIAVGFGFRCAGELEYCCKQLSSKQTIHTAQLQTWFSRIYAPGK